MVEESFPRRNRLDLNTPAELAIHKAIQAVEEVGADVRLTNIVTLLARAKDRLSDFVEDKENHYAPISSDNYVDNACRRTESKDFEAISARFTTENIRLLHAALGMGTEAAEIQDALKKHLYYGKPLDRVNLIEEAGDLLWYISIICDVLNVPLDYLMQVNIVKLQKRYPNKYSDHDALNRDVDNELSHIH